ncbi:uncharacterized protein FPRO_12745 [Fusarium proliferatum ET1]|uniref:Methyltransferase type 11 domain-containing protein n=1 Tax=Fusarium proliferatum (strain ET1) TaxID=1227346 RepID=A0A1L7W688_FUSPR|nr:uncharacterized protein FPRO_12745 [Fusarium proliferatum ET1]CZR48135.1 uncharacterized protein FPRO_12745 [Fusarium proliferatum ET1]
MVNIARERSSSYSSVHTPVISSEELSFPDDTFIYSITNVNLMCFTDTRKGAREIVRALQHNRVVIVIGWTVLGHIEIIQEVQAQIRPDETPFKPPVPDIWLDSGIPRPCYRVPGSK